MGRKEKKTTTAPRAALVFVGLACGFGVVAASGYLWQKGQIQTLGQQIRQYETRLEEAKRRRLTLGRMYAEMCSPVGLDARVKRMRLEIGPPAVEQIVRLWEPVPAQVGEELVVAQGGIGEGSQRLLTSSPTRDEGQRLLTSSPTEREGTH